MADLNEAKTKIRHRKSTCAGCRRRKSKCSGTLPKCTTCIACKDECVYDKPPSLAYVRSLEDEVESLRNQLKAAKTQAWVATSIEHDAREILPATSPTASAVTNIVPKQEFGTTVLPYHPPRSVKWEADISVDEYGSISFHNSTSAIHQPPTPQQAASLSPPAQVGSPREHDEEQVKQDLRQNAIQQRRLEPHAIGKTAARISLPNKVSEELMRFHWCWIHPLFLFVYRPAFVRGMDLVDTSQPHAPDPPYYSEALLRVVQSHCARFLNHDVYQQYNIKLTPAEFLRQTSHDARVSLAMTTLEPSSIPSIQALLQQSAKELVAGRSSQGWLYGGMAFRMAFDMGIHLPCDRLQNLVKSLTPEDIEIRKRLFWSCYTWDKIISLYLGRMPAFTPNISEIPMSFMDDYTDTELWDPYYGENPHAQAARLPKYTPCPGFVVSCFQRLSKLCIILNDIMHNLYASDPAMKDDSMANTATGSSGSASPFMKIARSLQQFWSELPSHLKVPPGRMPLLAPPIHIMSLNLLFHTALILLHRPVVLGSNHAATTTRSYQTCVVATSTIHDLLVLQSTTFGLDQISYLNAYCAYMAATIAVLRFERERRPGEDHATASKRVRLDFLLDVIARSAGTMPGLQRSNVIIKRRVQGVIFRHENDYSFSSAPTIPPADQLPLPPLTKVESLPSTVISSSADIGFLSPDMHVAPSHTPSDTIQSTMPPNTFADPNLLSSGGPFAHEYLPAFPGQAFPVGSEHSWSAEQPDPYSQMPFMEFNLDSYSRLDPNEIDWTLMDNATLPDYSPGV